MRSPRLVILAVTLSLAIPATAGAVGGPVILGGDDLTDHGSRDSGSGASQDGWLYIEKAIGNIKPQVARANDGSIAAMGPADPGPGFPSGDAGAAIQNAAQKNGMGVRFFDGEAAINSGFSQIAAGSYRPGIIWIAGDGASNDLGSCEGAGTDGQAVTNNAQRINDFVNQGGGLMSHGSCYQWLSALLPGLQAPSSGGSGDLYLTARGTQAFPGVTAAHVNAGPWHNHFQGNFGGLDLLVRSNDVNDSAGQDASVVIGGGQVSLTERPTDLSITKIDGPDPARVGENLAFRLTVRNNGPNPATGVRVSDTLPGGLSARSTTASQGTCTGTRTVTCNLGNLASGASATVRIVVRPRVAGTLRNTATVAGNQPDPTTANNSDSSSTTVRPPDRTAPVVSVAGVAGSAGRGGRRGCTSRSFRVRLRVREARLRRVTVSLDGRRLRSTSRKRFSVLVRVRGLRAGRHVLTIVATDRAGNRRVVRRAFRRCAQRRAAPRFTG